jgi:hypothetical protein
MNLTILLWRAPHGGGYYWQVPTHPVQWSGDIGTAAKEALTLASTTYPNITAVAFTLA